MCKAVQIMTNSYVFQNSILLYYYIVCSLFLNYISSDIKLSIYKVYITIQIQIYHK